ncbi:SDR family NAD(P)-dependent oxidoreductase [Croceivirga sp. JEA036]|uniref:SDR family NAD(P)-dependent oxidoreductase n=1 Tax=Croceivirga sp. JEA036 TaxID=2721162 RepID=UPI00143C1BAD|nr:SDR family oxidoreductase [Croceivirga sp. JEA036]NJB37854.1 SDR family oxidoreductase [Croceivirga sp. JEA036]
MKQQEIALVTGGSRGLGKNMALQLAKGGKHIILTYHTHSEAAEDVINLLLAEGVKAIALPLDTTKTDTFSKFFEQLIEWTKTEFNRTTIDYLINNAGTGHYVPFLETTEIQFDEMVNIHLKGTYFLTQQAVPYLKENGGIVNITSGLARFSLPNCSAYASAKGGLEVLTRYLAKELAFKKIRANAVAPGAVATDFGGGENKNNEQKREVIAKNTALGRVGEPEDIGGIVAFLCSDAGKWINGQRLEASGGIFL